MLPLLILSWMQPLGRFYLIPIPGASRVPCFRTASFPTTHRHPHLMTMTIAPAMLTTAGALPSPHPGVHPVDIDRGIQCHPVAAKRASAQQRRKGIQSPPPFMARAYPLSTDTIPQHYYTNRAWHSIHSDPCQLETSFLSLDLLEDHWVLLEAFSLDLLVL